MSIRDENLKNMQDILTVLGEALGVIKAEVGKCETRVEHLKQGLIVEGQIGPQPTVLNPLDAPEIVGADKDGNGGMAFILDESDGEG